MRKVVDLEEAREQRDQDDEESGRAKKIRESFDCQLAPDAPYWWRDKPNGRPAGLYYWTGAGSTRPRVLLGGEIKITAVEASVIRGRTGTIRLRIAVNDSSVEVEVTPRSIADESAWAPLTGRLPVVTPGKPSDKQALWPALRLLAAKQAADDPSILRSVVDRLGWHQTEDGAWERLYLDGMITAAGIERPGRLRIDRDEQELDARRWNQVLPMQPAEQLGSALKLAPDALQVFLTWFHLELPDLAPAIIGALARVTARPLPDEREPGSVRWQFEVAVPSNLGKTSLFNAGLRMFCGATYDYESGTELTSIDTKLGELGRRAQLVGFAYQDADHSAPPQQVTDWERQQRHRIAVLNAVGNREGGGVKSSREGVPLERARPAGLELRTFPHDPHDYSVKVGDKQADTRALTFVAFEPGSDDWPNYLDQCSGLLFSQLATALDALHIAWHTWQAQLSKQAWAAAVDVASLEATDALKRYWDTDAQVTGVLLVPPRVRGIVHDVLVGHGLYRLFLREVGQDQAAELLDATVEPLVRGRLKATLELFNRHEASTSSAARDHILDGLEALRVVLEAEGVRLDPADFEGERTLRVREPSDDERRSRPRKRVGYEAVELGPDGGTLRHWWTLIPGVAFDELRAQYKRTHGYDFPIDLTEWARGLEARGLLALTDRKTNRPRSTARLRVREGSARGGEQSSYLVMNRIGPPSGADSADSADSGPSDQEKQAPKSESTERKGSDSADSARNIASGPESAESAATSDPDSANSGGKPPMTSDNIPLSPLSPLSPYSSEPPTESGPGDDEQEPQAGALPFDLGPPAVSSPRRRMVVPSDAANLEAHEAAIRRGSHSPGTPGCPPCEQNPQEPPEALGVGEPTSVRLVVPTGGVRHPNVRAQLTALQRTPEGHAVLDRVRLAWAARGLPAPWEP